MSTPPPPTGSSPEPEEVWGIRPELVQRRRIKRQRLRRRRLLAGAAAVVVVAAGAAAAVALSGGSSPSHPSGASTARHRHHRRHGRRHHRRRHRAHRAGGASSGSAGTKAAAANGVPHTVRVPILMYHVIAAAPAGARFPGLYVPPAEFAEQMRTLHASGYRAVTMDQVLANWRHGTPLPPGKPVVLSFDNGYRSQYTQALPALKRYGWVGVENIQLAGLPPSQGGISPRQIRGLIAAGWELDTQGYSHAELPSLTAPELHFQVATTRATLRRRYGVPVRWFCYPSGHYDAAVVAAVKAAGYVGSTTVVPGWASRGHDRYRLPRLRVLGGTTGAGLLALIDGARDDQAPPPEYL